MRAVSERERVRLNPSTWRLKVPPWRLSDFCVQFTLLHPTTWRATAINQLFISSGHTHARARKTSVSILILYFNQTTILKTTLSKWLTPLLISICHNGVSFFARPASRTFWLFFEIGRHRTTLSGSSSSGSTFDFWLGLFWFSFGSAKLWQRQKKNERSRQRRKENGAFLINIDKFYFWVHVGGGGDHAHGEKHDRSVSGGRKNAERIFAVVSSATHPKPSQATLLPNK